MTALKTAFLVMSVIFVAAVTIWFAFQIVGDGRSVFFAAAGPVLLAAAIWAHLKGRKG